MTRRNLIQEILSRRGRHPAQLTRIDLFRQRYAKLESAFKELLEQGNSQRKTCHPEFGRYFPVALVACIEGYFRFAIANLIDKGSPYIHRVTSLRDVNVSIDAAAAIQTQKITLGEYVAHFISISSLDDVNRSLSALMGFDFLERMATSKFDLFEGEDAFHLETVRGDFVTAVKDLFQTRHVLCHEFATETHVDNGQMVRGFIAADILVGLSEAILWAEGV